MKTKVYLYSRVSTTKQTLEQQENTVYTWLNNNHMNVDVIVSDEGVSGKVSYKDRKLGKELIPQMKRGDILIVSEVSRLGRSMHDISTLINTDLKNKGIRLVIVSMGLDIDCSRMSSVDELILANFAFAAQLERRLISERVTSSLKVKREQGIKIGRANENYTVNAENQAKGNLKRARKRNYNTLVSREFQSFCRILKRVYPKLAETVTDEPLFMVNWKDSYVDYDKAKADICINQIEDVYYDSKQELFSKWDFSDKEKLRTKFFSKIQSTFRTINKYRELNNL